MTVEQYITVQCGACKSDRRIVRLRKATCTKRAAVHVTTIIIVNLGPLRRRRRGPGGSPVATRILLYHFTNTNLTYATEMDDAALEEIVVILILCARSMLQQMVIPNKRATCNRNDTSPHLLVTASQMTGYRHIGRVEQRSFKHYKSWSA